MDKKEETMVNKEATQNKIKSLLQFARKAGVVQIGFDASVRCCLKGKCELIMYAEDLAENSCKRLLRVIDETGVPAFEVLTKKDMSELFDRQEIGIISVNDVNFANGLKKHLKSIV